MSRYNSNSRHHGSNDNNFNRNQNTSSTYDNGNDDNNYHLRNPYSPHAMRQQHHRQQQQQQQQQPNGSRQNGNQSGGSNLSHPSNPYVQKPQQHRQQHSAPHQHNTSATNSSFAITPIENQQQQHEHKENRHAPTQQIERPMHSSDNLQSDRSNHPVQPQADPQQQQQQHSGIDHLRDQLDQLNEKNFELEADNLALHAELAHTRQTMKQEADSERSKLMNELRLAQQQMKRMKARLQQQEKGRSIVRDAVAPTMPETSRAFSNRLLGDSAGLRQSSPQKKKQRMDGSGAKVSREQALSEKNQSFVQEPRRQHDLPVARLARSLLEQLKPSTVHKQGPNNSKGSQNISESTSVPMDIEKDEKDIDGDISIRQVLFSVASMRSEENSIGKSPTIWTAGKLTEWLAGTFSSETSERYWSTILLQSPEARKYVGENVCLGHNGSSGEQERQNNPQHGTLDTYGTRFRRRRNRIAPVSLGNNQKNRAANLDEWQTQARQSLHNPWCSPNDVENTNGSIHKPSDSFTLQESSSLFFRKWVTSLAASKNPRHLHILCVLLAEEAGRKDLTGSVNDRELGTWWDLCYPSIAVTIQRIVYEKLIRSREKREQRLLASARKLAYNNSSSSRNAAVWAASESRRRRRYRIGVFTKRLQKLQDDDIEDRSVTNNSVAAMDIDSISDAKSSTRSLLDIGLKGSKIKTSLQIKDVDEEKEDKVLACALSAFVGLLRVASPEQLQVWCRDRTGLGIGNRMKKGRSYDSSHHSPRGGLFMVSLVLDLLEELQFDRWVQENDSTNFLSTSRLFSSGVLPEEKIRRGVSEDGVNASMQSPSSILPQWYDATITLLTQVGKTREGVKILRSRVLDDPGKSDFMGNALDVSIRHMHTLTMHLDDASTRHGSIVRFEGSSAGNDYHSDLLVRGDPLTAVLLRSVEAWVRLWHQITLYTITQPITESTKIISLRSLVLDLQDWFTSTGFTLLASEEIRQEIKAMIRWQLDELSLDEEDYEYEKITSAIGARINSDSVK